ncbi:helix-turn-helix domain-containing protein [Psychrobacillus sp. NPDC093180]|uniref:helix-turn-helix domain-containing protein n=1 Tax=Psychrobacillus sp. NPDC093180 TaxID=3364489 RepID=UPI0038030BA2
MKKMKVQELLQSGHSLMNNIVMDTAGLLGEAYFTIKIDDLLKERGITQKDLAQMTGMRVGTISELVNGKGISINKVQLFALMAALRVKSIDDLYEMQFPEDLEMTFEKEQAEWKSTKEMPVAVKEMYKNNVLKSSGLL